MRHFHDGSSPKVAQNFAANSLNDNVEVHILVPSHLVFIAIYIDPIVSKDLETEAGI